MRRTWLTIAITLILAWGLAWSGSADEAKSIRISAARAGLYDVGQQLFVAEGEVQIEAEDTLISGDYVEWRLDRNELVVSGNVRLRQEKNELAGDYLVYDVTQDVGEFLNPAVTVEVPKAEGPLYLTAEKMDIAGGEYRFVNGRITTCDLGEPHFYLAVKELELIPDDKLIIRNVTYYEGSIPLFYWPYLILPVGKNITEFLSFLPLVGYSATEGFYIKNSFDYYLNPNHYGAINLDLYSKLGIGYGLTHSYVHDVLGSGKVGFYHVPFSENSRISAQLDHEWSRGPWRFVTNNQVSDRAGMRASDLRSRLTLTTSTIDASLNGSYRENVGTMAGKAWEYGASWRQQLSDRLKLTLNGNVNGRESTTTLRMVNYLADLTYNKGIHTVALAVEQKYNPDLLVQGATPTWSSVNRTPELSWRMANPRMGALLLPVRLDAAAGRYHEFPSNVEDWRLSGTLALSTRFWRPTASTTISYGGDAGISWYGQNTHQTVLAGRVSLTQQLGRSLRLTARFNEKDVFGESPFRFDKAAPSRTLTLSLNGTHSVFSWSASTSYNFLTSSYGTLAMQGTWRPFGQVTLSLSAGYDLNTRAWGNIVPRFEYTAKDEKERTRTFKLGGRYDVGDGEWDQVEMLVKTPVGQDWAVEYHAIYKPTYKEFATGQVKIDKELHCRSLSFAYDHVKERVAFSITVNAFPTLPLGWDSEEGVSLFDMEDVFDLIGVEK